MNWFDYVFVLAVVAVATRYLFKQLWMVVERNRIVTVFALRIELSKLEKRIHNGDFRSNEDIDALLGDLSTHLNEVARDTGVIPEYRGR